MSLSFTALLTSLRTLASKAGIVSSPPPFLIRTGLSNTAKTLAASILVVIHGAKLGHTNGGNCLAVSV